MRKNLKYYLIFLCFLGFESFAKDMFKADSLHKGIKFECGLSWKQIKEKAKRENKYIFVDCYTTWCGPCKTMANQVFVLPEVGAFFNGNFINVKVQFDQTEHDSEEISAWYNDARLIKETYKIYGYPTYLYLNPEGKLVHTSNGMMGADDFIKKSSDAFFPGTQYNTLLDRISKGEQLAPAQWKHMAIIAQTLHDTAAAREYSNKYFDAQTELQPKDVPFLLASTKSGTGKKFQLLRQHVKEIDSVVGYGAALLKLKELADKELLFPNVRKKGIPDWNKLRLLLKDNYAGYEDQILLLFKLRYYMSEKDVQNFDKAMKDINNKFEMIENQDWLNSMASFALNNIDNKVSLRIAKEWSLRASLLHGGLRFKDTYANILYKLGEVDKAIAIERELIRKTSFNKEYSAKLEKMLRGEATWKKTAFEQK